MSQLKKISILVLASVMAFVAGESFYPDQKYFFYTDLIHKINLDNRNQSDYVLKFSLHDKSNDEENQPTFNYKMRPSPLQTGLQIASSDCKSCGESDNKNSIDPQSTLIDNNIGKSMQTTQVNIDQWMERELYSNTCQMQLYQGSFYSDLKHYDRRDYFSQIYFNMIQSCSLTGLDFSTMFGFQYQPQGTMATVQNDFMRRMLNFEMISSYTISFNLRSEYEHTSYVKFGGFDEYAFKNGKKEDMKLFKTSGTYTWGLPLISITDAKGGEFLQSDSNTKTGFDIILDPSHRYIFMQETQQIMVSKAIIQSIKVPDNTIPECSETSVCIIDAACKQLVALNPNKSISFNMQSDEGTVIAHSYPIWRLLVEPGNVQLFDPKYENKCALGIFRSKNLKLDTIFVGYEFFREYYVMYDASPIEQHGQDYIQVGIAERNKEVDIGQVRYDPKFPGYERAYKEYDGSKIKEGHVDQYDMAIEPDQKDKATFFGNDPDHVKRPPRFTTVPNVKVSMIALAVTVVLMIIGMFICCHCIKKLDDPKMTYVLASTENAANEDEEVLTNK